MNTGGNTENLHVSAQDIIEQPGNDKDEEPASGTIPHILLSPSRAAPLCTAPCASRSTTAYVCQTVRKGSPRFHVGTPRGAHLLLDTIFF